VLTDPESYDPMRWRAADWAQQLTLEALREALRAVLEEYWQRPLAGRKTEPTAQPAQESLLK
jgi:hypothetical protein